MYILCACFITNVSFFLYIVSGRLQIGSCTLHTKYNVAVPMLCLDAISKCV